MMCRSSVVEAVSTFKIITLINILKNYRGADKSLARPGRKQATETEDFEFLEITNLTHYFMYLFISCLHMFRASQRSSSGDRTVLIHHLV